MSTLDSRQFTQNQLINIFLILCILLVSGCTATQNNVSPTSLPPTSRVPVNGPTTSPVTQMPAPAATPEYVVLISCDACRPEYFDLVEMPNLEGLIQNGVSYSGAWVGAVENITPPSHTQMSTGAFPKNNGILGFSWSDGQGERINPTSIKAINDGEMAQIVTDNGVPTLAGLFKAQDPNAMVIAMSTHKIYAAQGLGMGPTDYIVYTEKIKVEKDKPTRENIQGYEPPDVETVRPAAVHGHAPEQDFLNDPALQATFEQPGDDARYAFQLASSLFTAYKPRLLMINVSEPDSWGHKNGGLTEPEIMAQVMRGVDDGLGKLLETYRQAGIFDRTLWVFVADHGMTPTTEHYALRDVNDNVNLSGRNVHIGIPLTYLNKPAQAAQVAGQIQAANLPGVTGIYHRIQTSEGYAYQAVDGSAASLPADLNQAYLYLLNTFASQGSPDIVTTMREGVLYEVGGKHSPGTHNTINWANQHIPLVLSGPGIKTGITSEFPARLVDIAPTIARLFGMPINGMDGVVLSDAMSVPTPQDVQVQAQVNDWLSPLRDALRNFAAEQATVPG